MWTEVDEYVVDLFLGRDDALRGAVERSAAEGLPDIQVSAAQGAFLGLLVRGLGARRVLEIGTLGGFSTIFLARALPPGGVVTTLEIDAHHAAVARANLEAAGVSERVRIVHGDAHATLERFLGERVPPFDFVFVDAEKEGYISYLDALLPLCRVGTMIVADNVVRQGEVLHDGSEDPRVVGARAFNAHLAAEPSLESIVLQTVGSKGHDGFAIAVVRDGTRTTEGGV